MGHLDSRIGKKSNLQLFDFRYGGCDDVLMFYRHDWQIDAGHLADFLGPEAAGVHHMLGVDASTFGLYVPSSIGAHAGAFHRAVQL